jgi:hypothetical protein
MRAALLRAVENLLKGLGAALGFLGVFLTPVPGVAAAASSPESALGVAGGATAAFFCVRMSKMDVDVAKVQRRSGRDDGVWQVGDGW